MNITEQEAREALKNLYEMSYTYFESQDSFASCKETIKFKHLLSTLITRFFEMEKALKEIRKLTYPTYSGWGTEVNKIATEALAGKGL